MGVSPAKCRVEIFPEPALFDDHFLKGWAKTGVVGLGEDTATLIGHGAIARIEKDLPSVNTDVYKRIMVRTTLVTGGARWSVRVYDGTTWHIIWDWQSGVGFFEAPLPAGKTLTRIMLLEQVIGTIHTRVDFDYVAICKRSVVVPTPDDVVDELEIKLPVLSKGVSEARLTIPNFGGVYNERIRNHDAILIWLSRDEALLGSLDAKVFGGRIVKLTNRADRYGAFFIDLEAYGHAYELITPPSLVRKVYSGVNGRAIIEDILASCSYLTRTPIAERWFDADGASGSTDDRIASNHDVKLNDEKPFDAIKEISDKAKNPAGIQGFDIIELPPGVLIGHLHNSLDFTSGIESVTPESYERSIDVHRVRNHVRVYGKPARFHPADEAWTESLSGWTALEGSLELSTSRVKGSYSIKANPKTTSPYTVEFYRTFSPIDCSAIFKGTYSKLEFNLWQNVDTGGLAKRIILYAPNDDNFYALQLHLSGYNLKERWYNVSVKLGYDRETTLAYVEGLWFKYGDPKWEDVKGIEFLFAFPSATGYALIDNLRFSGRHYETEALDGASIGLYGRRFHVEADESLESDSECLLRAQSLLSALKDPVVTLSDVVVEGDIRYRPGDRQRIIVANDALDAHFRVIEVKHAVKGSAWDTALTLSAEPQRVDYVFRMIQEARARLERRA